MVVPKSCSLSLDNLSGHRGRCTRDLVSPCLSSTARKWPGTSNISYHDFEQKLRSLSEPCIRGHRSTKCTHANERLMVPVRKPGRPLSSCPHPSSKPCSCGAVTAAIPRKQKCGCGPSDNDDSKTKSDNEESDTVTTAPADAKVSNPNFRVQKASRRGSTRKPSVDPAGLERMDSSQLNLVSGFDGSHSNPTAMSSGPPTPMGGIPPYSALGMTPTDSFGNQPMVFPMFPQAMQPAMMANGHSTTTSNGATPAVNGSSMAAPTKGSCCGGGNTNGNTTKTVPTPEAMPSPEPKTKSCCSSKNADTDTKSPPVPATPIFTPQQQHGMMMSPFPTPMPMAHGMYPFFPQPTIFTYPPNFGTYMQPLQPEQWRQMMAAFSYGQPAPANGFEMPPAAPTPAVPPYSPAQESSPKVGTSHQCTCGEGCQCVGCAAHPYNDATQEYVRSAWNSMMEDQPHTSRGFVKGHHYESSTSNTPNDTTAAATAQGDSNGTATGPHTPSDAASSLNEEQTLSANDFFFVSYSLGDACAGDGASCPCGDDCQCIGCVIHGNPPLEEEPDQQ